MRMRLSLAATLFSLVISTGAFAVDKHPDPLPVKDSAAETEKEMKQQYKDKYNNHYYIHTMIFL